MRISAAGRGRKPRANIGRNGARRFDAVRHYALRRAVLRCNASTGGASFTKRIFNACSSVRNALL
jgi:hypothetical protein